MKLKDKVPSSSPLEQLLGGEKKGPEKPKNKKINHKKTVVEHHFNADGQSKGHTIRHSPDTPDEVSYTAANLDGVNSGMKEHIGDAGDEEKAALPSIHTALQAK
jgi:hypothetical protein